MLHAESTTQWTPPPLLGYVTDSDIRSLQRLVPVRVVQWRQRQRLGYRRGHRDSDTDPGTDSDTGTDTDADTDSDTDSESGPDLG